MKIITGLLLVALFAVAVPAWAAEKKKEDGIIEKGFKKTGEYGNKASEKTGEALKWLGRKTKEGAKKTKKAIHKATED